MVNASPLIATDPAKLDHARRAGVDVMDEINNAKAITAAAERCRVWILAWGAGIRPWMDRGARLLRAASLNTYCFGRTKMGEPRHPLYLRNDTPLVRMVGP